MIDKDSPLGQSYEKNKQKSQFYRQARFYSVSQAVEWLEKLAYKNVEVCQTIFKDLSEISAPEPVKNDHGVGGFAVIGAFRT